MEKKLNKSQLEAVTHGEGPLLIIAGAGTGKTTVITERVKHLISEGLATPSEILALTFTEKAALEMEGRIDEALPLGYAQMWVMTFHGFCDRVLRQDGFHIGLDTKFRLMTTADSLDLLKRNLYLLGLDYFAPLGNPTKFLSGLLSHFSRLQDENVTPHEYLHWAQKYEAENGNNSEEEKLESLKWNELSQVYRKYEELKIKNSLFDFGDLITKTILLFEKRSNVLSLYQKKFKYILVDEFQDTNYAQNKLVTLLAGKAGNITVVGDDDQCLPFNAQVSTPDGDKPISTITIGDTVFTAVGRGHVGVSLVSKVFVKKKKSRFLIFTTESGRKLRLTDNHKMFCMIPGRKFGKGDVVYVYIMFREGMGWRLGITDDLAQRLKLERSADKIIAVKSCVSLEEARFFESVYSMRYQIPTYPFKPRKRMILTNEWLTKLFVEFDTEDGVARLCRDLGIDPSFHHYCLDAVVRGQKERIKITLNMCVRKYRVKKAHERILINPKIVHVVNLQTSSQKTIDALVKNSIPLTVAKKGMRVRRMFSSLDEASDFAKLLTDITTGTLEVRFNCALRNTSSRSSLMMPAQNILPGMRIPVLKNKEVVFERVETRKEQNSEEVVYDLEIDSTHNFIADGVVVHNSIYRFRGAAVSNMLQFREHFPNTKIVTLTENYRSKQTILTAAHTLISHNNPDRLEVIEKIDKKLVSSVEGQGKIELTNPQESRDEADFVTQKILELKDLYNFSDFAVLVRANNHAESFVRSFEQAGVPYQFLGPGKLFSEPEIMDLISYLRVVSDIHNDAALYRVLSSEVFGIDPLALAKKSSRARHEQLFLFDSLEIDLKVESAISEKILPILTLITDHVKRARDKSIISVLLEYLEKSGLREELIKEDSVESLKRIQNIEKFLGKIKSFEINNPQASFSEVVDWIDLQTEINESPSAAEVEIGEEDKVNILTVHSSKGLEFPVVFLVNLVSQRFPSIERREQIPIPDELIREVLPSGDFHMQEERRLFYVGLTRAKNEVYLTGAKFYGDGKREKKLSPFVVETLGELDAKSYVSKLLEKVEAAEVKNISKKFAIKSISYSQIETFKVCPLHYKLHYILKIPTPPTAAQSFGVSFHATLKEFYDTVALGSEPTKGLLKELLTQNWIREGYSSKEHLDKTYQKANGFLEYYLDTWFDTNIKPIALEQPFSFKIEDLSVKGKIDRIDETPTGIHIIDYKTGSNAMTQKEADCALQLSIYALAATKIPETPFNRKPTDITLSLLYFDTKEIVTTHRTPSQLKEAEDEMLDWALKMSESDFVCSGNFLCGNCEYKSFCAASLNSSD